eukprot:g3090.t1
MAEEVDTEAQAALAIIPAVILGILAIIYIVCRYFLLIVHQAEGVVIERFGKFSRVLLPGINFVLPIVEAPRTFSWTKTYIDANKKVRETKTQLYRIDCRESLLNFPTMEVYSRDTVNLSVNLLMYYRIYNVRKAIYGVDDLYASVYNVAQAEIKTIMGSMTMTEVLTAQDRVNIMAREKFNNDFEPWGVVCTRLEILDITPPANISRNLKMQMLAERSRRAQFIEAEGRKSVVKLESDGVKVVKFQTGVAEQEATRKRSEGEAQSKVALAKAESEALSMVTSAIQRDGATQTEFKIAQKYMDMVSAVSKPPSSLGKTIYLPYAAKDIMGKIMGELPRKFGSEQSVVHVPSSELRRRGSVKPNFDDLN